MKHGLAMAQEAAETLAVQAFTFIAADGDRLGQFLAETGIGPAEIRAASHEPAFLAGVLDYLAGDEALLTDFAKEAGFDPFDVAKARLVLSGGTWEPP